METGTNTQGSFVFQPTLQKTLGLSSKPQMLIRSLMKLR